ncbi:MAG: sulfite oxidase heme-binding subunit YedZ [Gammaproteobacteria bacterium]
MATNTRSGRKFGTNERIRFIGKPLVFLLALVPFAIIALRASGLYGELGANPVEEILDHFGNWGLRLLLITLCITPLRHVIGKAWPLRFRRMLGLFAFFYVAMHFATYFWLDQGLDVSAVIEDIIKRPFITLGLISVVILLALALTSPHFARRRLGKNWQKLHYLVYPAAILSVWHYWWQVKKDIAEPLVYAVILAALLAFRVVQKRRRRKTVVA